MPVRRRPRARRPRRLSRAQRRARSFRPNAALELWLAQRFEAIAKSVTAAVRAGMKSRIEAIGVTADAAGSPSYKKWLGGIKAQAKAKAKAKALTASDGAEKKAKTWSQAEFARIGIKLRSAEPSLGAVMDEFRRTNVERITGMLDDQLDKFENILREGEGRRVESLAKDFENQLDITENRARLIARDQVLTLNAQVNQTRAEAAGITRYIWTTAGDERVRGNPSGLWPDGMHFDLDGEEFDFDDPPVTNDDGDTNNPGEDYQCRCTAFPIIPAFEDDADADAEAAAE
jgi:SPP1 gp7 family putative phage head morphogenesis protein